MDRFIVKYKKQRLDSGSGGIKEEPVTDEQPQHSQLQEEDEGEQSEQQAKLARKSRSIHEENRRFQEKWTDEFFFVRHGTCPLCLICQKKISCFKRTNLERHYRTHHARYDETHPPNSQLRHSKITQLKGQLKKAQPTTTDRSGAVAEKTTAATFEIAWIIARNMEAFTDAEIVKECFLVIAEILYADLPNKESIIKQVKELQLSESTITRCIEDIGEDIGKQLRADVAAAPCFSIALDATTDVCGVAQLCVWVRFPQDASFREELLCLLPLRGRPRGEDVLSALGDFFAENGIGWSTLASVCTDGAPCMRDAAGGLLGAMRRRQDVPDVVAFHCIVHQEAVVAELSDGELRDVMQKAVQVVNLIIERGRKHRHFRELLETHRTEYGDLTVHNEERWLSRGGVLERVLRLLPEIRAFVADEGRDEPDLHDPRWVLKLAFLADITSHLNAVDVQLQGRSKAPGDMLRAVTAFQSKITTLFIPDRQFVHFPNLGAAIAAEPDLLEHYSHDARVAALEQLRREFAGRVEELAEYKELFHFLENPFNVSVASLSPVVTALCPDRARIESEVVELQANEALRGELRSGAVPFWELVSDAEYPLLKRCVQRATSFFVSTRACEATFSTMNVVRQNLSYRLTNAHLDYLTRIATTSYKFRMSCV